MTDVKLHYPKNALRKALNAPGAISGLEALRTASRNLDSIAEFSMQAVDRKIATIETMVAECCDPPSADERAAFHRLANEIFTESGAFGHDACSQAAHSLCDLVAAEGVKGRQVEAIAVHAASLKALRGAGAPEMRKAIVEGLRKLSRP